MPRNPFEPYSKEELLKIEADKKRIKAKKDLSVKLAQEIVNDPKFKEFKERVEDFFDDVRMKINEPYDPDPIQDAYFLRNCINTYNVLNEILAIPEDVIKENRNA